MHVGSSGRINRYSTGPRLVKRAHRIRKTDQFLRVRRDGRQWSSSFLILNAAPTRHRVSRCGFITGKRIGKAVDRNRARRRVREAVRIIFDRIVPGWDLVFVVRSSALITVEFAQVQAVVEQLLRRAGLLSELLAV